jgi:hypothetical protein
MNLSGTPVSVISITSKRQQQASQLAQLTSASGRVVASILIKQSSLCYWNKHDWARAFAEQPFLRKFRQGAIQQAVSVAAQNEQVNIESLGFVEQGSDDRAFNQQRRGINMLFPQGLREMVQKLVFMMKLPGHLAA